MKPLNHVERRVQMVLAAFAEHGPMTSAVLARHLGLPSAEAPLEGRKLRHILGDIGLEDWITRTGHKSRVQGKTLPVFQLTHDGRLRLEELQQRQQVLAARPGRPVSGLAALLKQARPVAKPGGGFFQPPSRVVPAPERQAAPPPYPIIGHAPQGESRLTLADKLACLESSAAQRNSQDLKLMVAVIIELHERLQRYERFFATLHASTQEVLPKEAS